MNVFKSLLARSTPPKTGLIYQEKVRKDFDSLKAVIKSGGK